MSKNKKSTAAAIATRAVIYARYSSSNQREESIEGQLRDCRAFAASTGLQVIAEYCDYAQTGTNDKRPQFQQMLADSALHLFHFVITWKHDRFARSRYDSAINKKKLEANGVSILYAKEDVPEGPTGILIDGMQEVYAEFYSANLAENVRRGNYDSALDRQTIGQSSYGLRRGADKRWEIDPATAPVVKRIFEEYAAGHSAKAILTQLNAEGYKTARGNPFNQNSIRRILENERYCGVYKYADIRDENGIPPIVDKDLFGRAQKMIHRHQHQPAAKQSGDGYLLTAKLYCGECGSSMTGDGGTSSTGAVYKYYLCNKRRKYQCPTERIRKDDIETAVIHAIVNAISDDATIEDFADRYMAWQAKQQKKSPTVPFDVKLKEVAASIRNVVAALESGMLSESLKNRLLELETEKKELEHGRAVAIMKVPHITREQIVYFLRRFRDGDIKDPAWRIHLVETFLLAAYVFPNRRVVLDLNFSTAGDKVTLETALNAEENGDLLRSSFSPSYPPHENPNLDTIVSG